ncbi:Uncharacterised protein [Neisseria animalis]|nr:Uncharacterised protein [Neisseria animalis]
MIQRCFALPYYVYCLRLRCLVSFLFYSTIYPEKWPLLRHYLQFCAAGHFSGDCQ